MKPLISSFFYESISSPQAYALIYGNNNYPSLCGIANFYESIHPAGLFIEVELSNLPNSPLYSPRFLGLHIHQVGDCSNNFTQTGEHYNPTGANHPYHLGDLPSILNSSGKAYLLVFDSFLSLKDVVHRSIIVHDQRDDFTSQPSGNSGNKIGCGVIYSS